MPREGLPPLNIPGFDPSAPTRAADQIIAPTIDTARLDKAIARSRRTIPAPVPHEKHTMFFPEDE